AASALVARRAYSASRHRRAGRSSRRSAPALRALPLLRNCRHPRAESRRRICGPDSLDAERPLLARWPSRRYLSARASRTGFPDSTSCGDARPRAASRDDFDRLLITSSSSRPPQPCGAVPQTTFTADFVLGTTFVCPHFLGPQTSPWPPRTLKAEPPPNQRAA